MLQCSEMDIDSKMLRVYDLCQVSEGRDAWQKVDVRNPGYEWCA